MSEYGDVSAILIETAQAESAVRPFRLRHDPVAALGVPAHVTLLFPFVPPASIGAVEPSLRRFFDRVRPFSYTLSGVGRFPEGILYLSPEPVQPFKRLTEALWQLFPAYPPYGGVHDEVVPHITVIQNGDGVLLDEAERTLSAHLPIECEAREAVVMQQHSEGMWTVRCRFPFGGRS